MILSPLQPENMGGKLLPKGAIVQCAICGKPTLQIRNAYLMPLTRIVCNNCGNNLEQGV